MKPNQISSKIHTSVLVPIEDYKKKLSTTVEEKTNYKKPITRFKKKFIYIDKKHKNSYKKQPIKLNPGIISQTKLRESKVKKQQQLLNTKPYDKKSSILDSITVNKNKISKLLDWLIEKQDVISWDRDKTLLLYNNPIPNTNIAAILRHVYTLKADPRFVEGAVVFYHALKDVNIPIDLIQNTIGKKIITGNESKK